MKRLLRTLQLRPQTLPPWLLLAALIVAALGYWGPWVAHASPALTLLGLDMAEYVKFLPAVQQGRIRLIRELFYLPLAGLSLDLTTLAVGWSQTRHWSRWGLLLLAVPTALAMLPPAWTPQLLWTPEFRTQTWMIIGCLGATVLGATSLAGLLPPLPSRPGLAWIGWLLALALLNLGAAILPIRQFLQVRQAIAYVYGGHIQLGTGLALTPLGLLMATGTLVWWAWNLFSSGLSR
ncbi:MAG TPA: hypothetical protein EYP04_05590 [Anaerolineae bacterium]|nr:hypothetical protein [Anaerolineae bacterium]HIQ05506.1 hypothetical protein [Anaerolineae bacterium]